MGTYKDRWENIRKSRKTVKSGKTGRRMTILANVDNWEKVGKHWTIWESREKLGHLETCGTIMWENMRTYGRKFENIGKSERIGK